MNDFFVLFSLLMATVILAEILVSVIGLRRRQRARQPTAPRWAIELNRRTDRFALILGSAFWLGLAAFAVTMFHWWGAAVVVIVAWNLSTIIRRWSQQTAKDRRAIR